MKVIFEAKTSEGYAIKVLAELLHHNIKTACFIVGKDGIRLCQMDNPKTILINLELDRDSFKYKFKHHTELILGINMGHLHKMLKSIKKRDSVQFFISKDNPNELGIKVIPKENNRVTTSFVTIQPNQTLDVDVPNVSKYDRPVLIPSGEFQKMCKGLAHISNETTVIAKGFLIKFLNDAGGIMKRATEFGEKDSDSDTDTDTEEEKDEATEYKATFNTEHFTRITKIAGLSTAMKAYSANGMPLLLKSQVSTLGNISIFIKSKEMIEEEEKVKAMAESDDDE